MENVNNIEINEWTKNIYIIYFSRVGAFVYKYKINIKIHIIDYYWIKFHKRFTIIKLSIK